MTLNKTEEEFRQLSIDEIIKYLKSQEIRFDYDEEQLVIEHQNKEYELSVKMSIKDLTDILNCLKLFKCCPPTIRQILEEGDIAINLSGLNPWCVNEGLSTGDEKFSSYKLQNCIDTIEHCISSSDS